MLGAAMYAIQEMQNKGKNPQTGALKGAQDEYLSQVQKQPTVTPSGEPVQPAWRTEDAIKGVLGAALSTALGGNDGLNNFLSSYVGKKQLDADQKTDRAEKKRQEENQQLKTAYELGNKVAETKLQFAQDDFNREQRDIERKQASKDKSQLDQERRDQISLNQAERDYIGAKSEVSMLQAAQRRAALQERLGIDVTPVDLDVVAQDWAERSQSQRNAIRDDHFRVVKDSVNEFGVIKGGLLEQITKSRNISAKEMEMYGLSEKDARELLFIPTEESLKKMKQDEWLKITQEKRADDHDRAVQAIAKSKADIERAKERIAIAKDNLRVRGFAADTARMGYELRSKIDTANKQIMGKVKAWQSRIDGLTAEQKKKAEAGDLIGAQNVEAKIKNAEAQRDFWKGEIEGPPEDVDKITATSGFSTQTSDGTKFSWKP